MIIKPSFCSVCSYNHHILADMTYEEETKLNYWGYRIDIVNRDYFYDEIKEGRLRQGWGYDSSQNLKDNDNIDAAAKRNLPIYNKVKKGDILLVPRIEGWDEIAIVEAVEDFDKGYRFEIDPLKADYGHIFPVRLLKCFSRHNDNVGGDIRETLKCRSRFWNINRCGEQIKMILTLNPEKLVGNSKYGDRLRRIAEKSFNKDEFTRIIYQELNKDTQTSEWEYILCEGLRKVFPYYSVETTSNRLESRHGADIIIRIPGLMNSTYIIAIQVKDHSEKVNKDCIDQICKADDYFLKEEGSILIDKYLIIIRAKSETNINLIKHADEKGVKVLFVEDVQVLLAVMGQAFLAETLFA